MSSTKRAVSAAGLVAVILAALMVWAVQASGSEEKTFTVNEKITAFTQNDLAPSGDSPGDLGVIAGTLTRNGKAAGSYQGYCVVITDPGNSQCTFTFALKGGQIVVTTGYGTFNGAVDKARSPIVGGTGAYSKALGGLTRPRRAKTPSASCSTSSRRCRHSEPDPDRGAAHRAAPLLHVSRPQAHWLMVTEVAGRVLVVPLAPADSADPTGRRPIGC